MVYSFFIQEKKKQKQRKKENDLNRTCRFWSLTPFEDDLNELLIKQPVFMGERLTEKVPS
jgi:hypothetical protein